MKGKIYLRQQLLKDSFIAERNGKGLLLQLKTELLYKILMDKAFVEDEDSPFQKIESHRKFNTQWGQYTAETWQSLQGRKYWRCALKT